MAGVLTVVSQTADPYDGPEWPSDAPGRRDPHQDRDPILWHRSSHPPGSVDTGPLPQVDPLTFGHVDVDRRHAWLDDGSHKEVVAEEVLVGVVPDGWIPRPVEEEGPHQGHATFRGSGRLLDEIRHEAFPELGESPEDGQDVRVSGALRDVPRRPVS